jgi:hypothetical protein
MLDGGASVQVKSFAGISLNEWYGVKGHESSGVLLPNQYIFVIGKVLRTHFWEFDTIICHHYMVMYGQLWIRENHQMSSAELNIGLTHGVHDIHLERMRFEQVASELAKATGQYREIQQERKVKGSLNTTEQLMKEIQK